MFVGDFQARVVPREQQRGYSSNCFYDMAIQLRLECSVVECQTRVAVALKALARGIS